MFSTLSLPRTPSRRLHSQSQSKTMQGDVNSLFIIPSLLPLPIHESPKSSSPRTGSEKECHCEASQHAKPDTIKRMQFTFCLDHLSPIAANVTVSKLDLKPSAALSPNVGIRPLVLTSLTSAGSQKCKNDFGPSALLHAQPSLSNTMNYGEDVTNTSSRSFSIIRPTIELPLDELLSNIDATEDNHLSLQQCQSDYKVLVDSDVVMQETFQSSTLHTDSQTPRNDYDADLATPPLSQSVKDASLRPLPWPSLNLTAKTHNAPTTHSSGPGATATSVNPAVLRGTSNNSAAGGVKAECSNCGATHTPLWRRGLNDKLNCNAHGLYCKLHKRPRPTHMFPRFHCGNGPRIATALHAFAQRTSHPDAPKDSPLVKSLMWPSNITLIALTFFQIALFDLLISLGLKPSGIVGHSVGEMAVLYASGAIPRSMQLSNSRLFVNVTGDGANGYTNKRCHVRYIELTHTPP
ncbi:hypothetical protein BU15DRAFT_75603 [Melanogaster broomeanus]|nr:hypothetical protein BU15DRAFT_75603 [Melanogaster broomeanus]